MANQSSQFVAPIRAVGRFVLRLWFYLMEEVDTIDHKVLLVIISVFTYINVALSWNPPGGFYGQSALSQNRDKYEIGKAIAAYRSPVRYAKMVSANTASFICCMSMLFLFALGVSLKRRVFSFILTLSLMTTIVLTTFTYQHYMWIINPSFPMSQDVPDYVTYVVVSSVNTWIVVAAVTLMVFVLKLLN
ncbi:hypothetical protein QVD17_14445 [Tagetes erecta]|uniref:PGG domain-containing protein n=1 Tax=Tagetes erecta TaxID=13708 RepID=A0AAD8P3Z1_TARER|nr:hypothetical protein QVD17_14445 [Tagetes erecta]